VAPIKYRKGVKMIQINLASGQRPFEKPWVNVDLIDQGYPIDIITDAKDLSMFEADTVDMIVAHHLVEHIAIHDLEAYVTEWWRVLKPGGILSIFVPNIPGDRQSLVGRQRGIQHLFAQRQHLRCLARTYRRFA
jgi:predicted SAM-dependent methyltransferase